MTELPTTSTNDATLRTAVDELRLAGPLTETAPIRFRGESVIGIRGDIPRVGAPGPAIAATVYVSRARKPLPVGMTYRVPRRGTETLVLSHWGEPISLPAPSHIITLNALKHASRAASHRHQTAAARPSSPTSATGAGWIGYWVSTGRVIAAHDSASEVRGEVLQRLWRIYRPCVDPSCPLSFERQTGGATANSIGFPLTAPLIRTSHGWSATFSEQNVYCQGATADYPGIERSVWQITRISSGTIIAVTTTRVSGPSCETGTTKILWTAHRRAVHRVGNPA